MRIQNQTRFTILNCFARNWKFSNLSCIFKMLKYLIVTASFTLIIFVSEICRVQCYRDIEFNVRQLPNDPKFVPGDRIEHAERNTSKAYPYWKQVNISFVEWPGNITILDPERPLLKWNKPRAKLINCPCNIPLAIDLKAYAFKYLHLTWGPFRMTASYCPPLKLPRKALEGNLPSTSSSTSLPTTDFEFVSTAFLILIDSQLIIRVGELESAHRREGSKAAASESHVLSFDLAKGITAPITKLVVQNCCRSWRTSTCLYGDYVMAINENSKNSIVFLSKDSGRVFAKLKLRKPKSIILHQALLFPIHDEIVVFEGNKKNINISRYSLADGKKLSITDTVKGLRNSTTNVSINGYLQAVQIGDEMSFVMWDRCRVWYSPDTGLTLVNASFYIHDQIEEDMKGKEKTLKTKVHVLPGKHRILGKHCHFGEKSTISIDPSTGKIGILDAFSNFFYGIDTKTPSLFPLIVSTMDMTLLKEGKEGSIVPFFDFNNRPKLMYPPRYLWSDEDAYKDPNYKKRLGMRLFPRSVFPSDFMKPFFEEYIPKRYAGKYGLKKCQTSSVVADSSISQKPKVYSTFETTAFNFTIEFKSQKNESNQLHVEPQSLSKYMRVHVKPLDFMKLGLQEYYYFKYDVLIHPKPIAFAGGVYRLNFFTLKSVRCIHQPQQVVWVKILKSEDGDSEFPFMSSAPDPERVTELKNFLNSSATRKIRLDDNPLNIKQCSRSKVSPIDSHISE